MELRERVFVGQIGVWEVGHLNPGSVCPESASRPGGQSQLARNSLSCKNALSQCR